MAVNISYMGTKRELATTVAEVIRHAQPGVMLDAFTGMGTVGEEVAPTRQVWTNDVQLFAAEVGRALFSSRDAPPGTLHVADVHFDEFERHRQRLTNRCHITLRAEDALLAAETYNAFTRQKKIVTNTLRTEAPGTGRLRWNLFTSTYADNYFGVRQAIEADAILHAVSSNHSKGHTSSDQKRWLTIALGRALLRVANSTGHFAQFLKPKRGSFERHIRQRSRSLWAEWLYSTGELCAVGTSDWRRRNKSFQEDSLLLLPKFVKAKERPAVIYADPPYTNDHYSRYYHLLDTMMLYDYPSVTGAGLYRPNRFQTPFSLKSKAASAFDSLVSSVAKTGADLVLSYPSNGLIIEAGAKPITILKKHFRRVECCDSVEHRHSTFGASKGSARANVTELIYIARP